MNGFFHHQNQHRSWGEIFLDLLFLVKSNVHQTMREKQIKVVRTFSSLLLWALGVIFFLVGLSLFLGMLINQTSWAGYIVVGLVLIVIGFLIPKK